MRLAIEGLQSRSQTAKRMHWLVDRFCSDLDQLYVNGRRLSDFSATDIYDFVRMLPYKKDTRPIELVARPRFIMQLSREGIDCKKKSVLLGSWAKCNGIPFRFIGMSSRADGRIHHVFPQFKDALGNWINYDATYSRYKIGQQKRVTGAEVL